MIIDIDEEYAKQLQEESDLELARQLQKEQDDRHRGSHRSFQNINQFIQNFMVDRNEAAEQTDDQTSSQSNLNPNATSFMPQPRSRRSGTSNVNNQRREENLNARTTRNVHPIFHNLNFLSHVSNE